MGPHRFKASQITDMASTSRVQLDIQWLYPDLLSEEELIHILKQRYIKAEGTNLENLDKESLVELYNRYILPLPQRKFRNNRHGKELTKRQMLYAKKRKIDMEDDNSTLKKPRNSTFQETSGPSRGSMNNCNGINRLKPPPSSTSFEKKVVQLGGSNKSCSSGTLSTFRSSQPSPGLDRKLMKLKSPGGDDGPSAKKPKLNDNAKNSLSQKGISKITWP